MRQSIRKGLIAISAGALLLGAAGCKSQSGHQKNVNAAEQRWLKLRSDMVGRMAQQQLETGDLETSEKTLVEAMSLDAKNPKLHVLAGRVALERSQLERAYQRFGRAIELDPNEPAAHYFQGIVLQRWERHDQALASYREAYRLQADNPNYLLAVGEVMVSLGQTEEAITLLSDKVTYFDQNAGIRAALGHLHAMRHEYDQSIRYFKESLLLRPDDPQTLEALATAQLAAGQVEDAIGNLERLRENASTAGRRDLQMTLAGAYMKGDRPGDARELYLKMSRSEPRDAEVWIRLAELSLGQRDFSGALLAANRAMTLAPRRPEGFLYAGLVQKERGKIDDALRMFDRAAEVAPGSSEAVILRGLTLQGAGRMAAAKEAYAEALRRNPEDARARRLLDNVSPTGSATP